MDIGVPPPTGSVGNQTVTSAPRGGNALAIFFVLVLMPAIIIGSLVALELFQPAVYEQQIQERMHIPPLYKKSLELWHTFGPKTAEQKQLEDQYERFCGNASGDTAKITQPLDVKKASFDDIDGAIKKAVAAKTPEPIALLRDSVVETVRTVDASETKLGQDAMQAVGEDFANKVSPTGKLFAQRFAGQTQKLNNLFLAFEKAGFTQSQSASTIKIGKVEHQVTNLELFLYSYWYASISDPSYRKLKLAKRTQINAVLVAYLEEVNEVLQSTNAALSELASGAADDITKAQSTTYVDAMSRLESGSPSDANTGFKMAVLSETLLHDKKDFDEAFKWQLCAAQKYYEPLSMYNISGYFAGGVEATTTPGAPVVKAPLKQDLHQAYFWDMALVLIDSLQYGFFTDTNASLGWNTISTIDAIQSSGQFTAAQLDAIEKEAHAFVEKKYPAVGVSGLEASVHSVAAAGEALKNSAATSTQPEQVSKKRQKKK